MIRLSVVTITFQDPEGLQRTLTSLRELQGSGIEWEHIIVDSSPEKNEGVFRSLDSGWPLQRKIEAPAGIYPAMNAGIAAARGEWIWLLNGGDRLGRLETLREGLRTDADLVCAGAALYRNGRYFYDRLPVADFLSSILGRNRLVHQGILYRRSALEKVGPFSSRYRIASDYEHHFRCYLAGLRARMLREPLAACDLGGTSDDYLSSWMECRQITDELRERLGPAIYRRQRLALWRERSRLEIVKRLGASSIRKALDPLWLAWNRRKG